VSVRIAKYFVVVLLLDSIFAIEGEEPVPRFLPPDFSVEEERITYPGDLIEFFRDPFVKYLNLDLNKRSYNPLARISSREDFAGSFDYSERGIFGEISGRQMYFRYEPLRKMLRVVSGSAGYATMLLDRYPVGVKLGGEFGSYRGEYEPTAYSVDGWAECHIPVGSNLLSLHAGGARGSWVQRPGPHPRFEAEDRGRQYLSNTLRGRAVFRSMPGEYTGFEIILSGSRTTRFEPKQWGAKYQVISGKGMLVYDSQPLRIAIGGVAHRTWEENILGPALDFSLIAKRFYVTARLTSNVEVPIRSEVLQSPRVGLPRDSKYIVSPMVVETEARIELKPDQFLRGKATYSNVRGEPVIWEPLAEAPAVVSEEVAHQSFCIALDNDFGRVKNTIALNLMSDEVGDRQLPMSPIRVIADTFDIDFGYEVTGWAAGSRTDLPELNRFEMDNIAVGLEYKFDRFEFYLSIENVLKEMVFDPIAMIMTDEMRVWGGIAVDF